MKGTRSRKSKEQPVPTAEVKVERKEKKEEKESDDEEEEAAPAPQPQQPPQPRWKTWAIRTPTSLAMIGGFFFIIWLGHFASLALVVFLQVSMFRETIAIARRGSVARSLPVISNLINWMLMVLAVVFFLGRALVKTFPDQIMANEYLAFVAHHHDFFCFSGYIALFVLFVGSLEKGKYKAQFVQLAWSHMIVFFVAFLCSFWFHNVLAGLFWFLLPASLVINNDIWAFIVGFMFGKTPLIKLSPKKTWEGFIGGAFFTFLWAFFISKLLATMPFLTCPKTDLYTWAEVCEPSPIFLPHDYTLPTWVASLWGSPTVTLLPAQLHAMALALFSSSAAPFGGFFASGLKRAFQLKDFDSMIPGHGGVTDRFDCQIIMGTFTNLYLSTFVLAPGAVSKIMNRIVKLSPEQQMELFSRFQHFLQSKAQ